MDTAERKIWARENSDFEQYYLAQEIVPAEEWQDFMDSLQRPLPVCYRLCGSPNQAFTQQLHAVLKHLHSQIESTQGTPPHLLNWYPVQYGLAYEYFGSRASLRGAAEVGGSETVEEDEDTRVMRSAMRSLHGVLVREAELGNISHQEAVSMVPALLLDICPGMRVLDMCAAPGSKTLQLIDLLRSDPAKPSSNTTLLVANDVDHKRACMILQRSRQGACDYLVVTHNPAELFPSHVFPRFDRILCDVPCTGDGTLRKNVALWSNWNWRQAFKLHNLQVSILLRGSALLRPGGRLVYSTCSLNPLENEAVISSALARDDSLRVVDVSNSLPGLKRRPGLTTWRVRNHWDIEPEWLSSADELKGRASKREKRVEYFPPPPGSPISAQLPLCLRLMPHDANTGGFFVCVLEKSSHEPSSELHADPPAASADDSGTGGAFPARFNTRGLSTDVLALATPSVAASLSEFYGIPLEEASRFVTRGNKSRSLYRTSPAVLDPLLADVEGQVRVVNLGVKVFEVSEDKHVTASCSYRLVHAGLAAVLPLMTRQRVRVSAAEMETLLRCEVVKLEQWGDAKDSVDAIHPGSCVLECVEAGVAVACRRGVTGMINKMIPAPEAESLLDKLRIYECD
eukprot:c15507_g1_i2.p1 GENE.c15507_g1_i2~~c15507_g1_i2.p1  ORF type:complete len:627 (+),score=118.61 c15507_g1_i2:100-1980(+)